MKKALSLVLAIVLAFAMCATLASCNAGKDESNTSATSDESKAPAETSLDPAYADFKVGAVYIGSQNDTAGYTYAHHNGITTAMQTLGIPAANLFIVDNVPEENEAVTSALNTLKGKGCKIIFGISFGYINAFDEAAKNPDFAGIVLSHGTGYLSSDGDAYKTAFNNYFGRIYQARYLAGIAAGLKSVEIKNDNIGYVAAFGTEYAETCSGINAFALGAMSVNPNAKVYVNKINTWGDEAKEKSAAEALVANYNVGVISQHCDSAQPLMVAQSKNIFGCGYNSDMTTAAPDAHLTAAIWHWDVYYATAMKAAHEDASKFMETVGNYYGGLKEGFVDISPLSKNCSEGTAEIIALVRDLMVKGEWDVFSGVSLSYTKGADGKYTVTKTASPVKNNKGEEVAAIDDGVIKGSMDYYVAGVTEG